MSMEVGYFSIMKVGIIRCQQTEDMCPGNTDFNPIGYPCPNFENIKNAIKKQVNPEILIIEWTH